MPPSPWMDPHHVELIDNTLMEFDRKISVVEWGVGRSTVYWCDLLFKSFVDFDWQAIEDNEFYIQRLQDIADTEWPLGIRHADNAAKYTELHTNHDVYIVDGRWRSECVLAAMEHLSHGGVIFLHDSHRRRYIEPLVGNIESFIAKTWMGAQAELMAFWRPDERP